VFLRYYGWLPPRLAEMMLDGKQHADYLQEAAR